MKHGTQTNIAIKANTSQGYISDIIAGKRKPSWTMAKKLAEITSSDPIIWVEGRTDEIKDALKSYN